MNDTIIGDALDISDGTGQDTILVGAGIYPEDVNLDKEVTLNGPAKGIAGVGTRSTEAVLKGFMSVVAGADGATVDGFTFDTDGLVDISAVVDALTVKNNIFKNQLETPVAATDVALTDFTLENNLFDALGATAVDIKGATSVTIKGNTIQNIDNDTAHGIELEDISLSATVSNNVIQLMSKAERGINILSTTVGATTGYSLSRNIIDKAGGAGIAFENTTESKLSITGNTITGNGKTPVSGTNEGGVYLIDGATVSTLPVTITGNSILQNTGGGVRVDGGGIGAANLLKISGNNFAADEVSTSNRTLQANLDLENNVTAIGGLGVFFTAVPTGTVDLTGNWWGNTTPTIVNVDPATNPRANIYSIGDTLVNTGVEQANSTMTVNFNTALSSGLSI
jgi:hypothetical protein